MEWIQGEYTLTDDPGRADIEAIHGLLEKTYWAAGRSRELVALSVGSSLCFSLFHDGSQVGVARVLTDVGATSYLCDVVIDPGHRDAGLGSWLMQVILEHPSVRRTRMLLITRDAQPFYRRLGFATHPYECMVRSPAGGGSQ
ncbi:MAG TPA: GNAT family N-acetyltransferase [Candidatus Polarisedimenticolia bacterium]|nr:GNAT family N-acetyltransferase [Candidatus Polarisedimenticolia bacterium]